MVSQKENKKLSIRYVPLETLLKQTAAELRRDGVEVPLKCHDIGELCASIEKYGFLDPISLDEVGVVGGNGRIEALTRMKEAGGEPPKNIVALKGGDWAVPCVDVEFDSIEELIAYAIDENNSVFGGGTIPPEVAATIWEPDSYLKALEELARDPDNLPETVGADDIDDIMKELQAIADQPLDFGGDDAVEPERSGKDKTIECPHCHFTWKPKA